jgi:hypothetical protein
MIIALVVLASWLALVSLVVCLCVAAGRGEADAAGAPRRVAAARGQELRRRDSGRLDGAPLAARVPFGAADAA